MGHPRKVLLVENDEFTRYMMREIIATLGIEVEIAVNGQEGVDILFRDPDDYGLILMDLHLPQATGIEAVRSIRANRPDPCSEIPIIAVTSDVAFHDAALVAGLGMNGFASKPMSPGLLLQLIDRFCEAA